MNIENLLSSDQAASVHYQDMVRCLTGRKRDEARAKVYLGMIIDRVNSGTIQEAPMPSAPKRASLPDISTGIDEGPPYDPWQSFKEQISINMGNIIAGRCVLPLPPGCAPGEVGDWMTREGINAPGWELAAVNGDMALVWGGTEPVN